MAKLISVIPVGPQGGSLPLTYHMAMAFQIAGAHTLFCDGAAVSADGASGDADPVRHGPEGLQILEAGGLATGFPRKDEAAFAQRVQRLEGVTDVDLIMVETPAGLSLESAAWALAADMAMIVLTPGDEALHDALALVNLLRRSEYAGDIRVVPFRFSGPEAADTAMRALDGLVVERAGAALAALPAIPEPGAGPVEEPLMLATPEHPVAVAVGAIVEALLADFDWSETRSLADCVRALRSHATNGGLRSALGREGDGETRRGPETPPTAPTAPAPERVVERVVERGPERMVDAHFVALMERNVVANERLADALQSLGARIAAGGWGAGPHPRTLPDPGEEVDEPVASPGENGVVVTYLTFEDLAGE